MELESFEELVRKALRTLPEEIARRMSNVDVEVQHEPTHSQMAATGVQPGHTLLGLYQGIPLTRRTSGYQMVPPDRIIIFQRPLERVSRGEEDLVRRVRDTVIHEVGHHFGISDARLRELEGRRRRTREEDSMTQAIDIHVHPPGPGGGSLTSDPTIRSYFRSAITHGSAEEMAEYYEKLDIFGVLFQIDFETASGVKPTPNDYIAELVDRYPKQFIGFGSVDPWKGRVAVREAERCATDLKLRGLKFHPQQQAFFPNDQRFYPLWEMAQGLGLTVLFHTGTTGVGVGRPGGGGIKLKYAKPIPYIDDVAADFPELTVIMAHPSFPWQDEQLAMLVHKPNVYMDMSGWSPKYFSPLLVQYAKTLAQDKVMFGSDYPVISPERWLTDFDTLGFDDAVRQKILIDNATRVLKLDEVP